MPARPLFLYLYALPREDYYLYADGSPHDSFNPASPAHSKLPIQHINLEYIIILSHLTCPTKLF